MASPGGFVSGSGSDALVAVLRVLSHVSFANQAKFSDGEKSLLRDNRQKGETMIVIMKTLGSQVGSPAAEEKLNRRKALTSPGAVRKCAL